MCVYIHKYIYTQKHALGNFIIHCVHITIYIYMICVCTCIYVYVCVYVCVYIYIYIYIIYAVLILAQHLREVAAVHADHAHEEVGDAPNILYYNII